MTLEEILNELVDHFAYEDGATDSGVRDLLRRHEMAKDDYRQREARWFREHDLSDEAIAMGYGMEDAVAFWKWLENDL